MVRLKLVLFPKSGPDAAALAVEGINLCVRKDWQTDLRALLREKTKQLDIVVTLCHNCGNIVVLGHWMVILNEIFAVYFGDRRLVGWFDWLYWDGGEYFATALQFPFAVGDGHIATIGTAE